MIRWAKGDALLCPVECEKYDVPGYAIDDMNQYGGFTGADTVQAAAALNEEAGELTVFVINADLEEAQQFTLAVRGFEGYSFLEHLEMHANSPDAANTFDRPDTLIPRRVSDTSCDSGTVSAKLEKASWNVFRFTALRKA